jgi:shikimate kinase
MSNIILIGFKHAGKSTIGRALAARMNSTFCDLDQQIEQHYQHQYHEALSCRRIMQEHGETFFRQLEHNVLATTLHNEPGIIALGGGTPLTLENQTLIKTNTIVHLIAPQDIVFARIMAGGRPAFFPADQDPHPYFLALWEKRIPIYQELAHYSVMNDKPIMDTIDTIMRMINS